MRLTIGASIDALTLEVNSINHPHDCVSTGRGVVSNARVRLAISMAGANRGRNELKCTRCLNDE
jgi:hypothetical protein